MSPLSQQSLARRYAAGVKAFRAVFRTSGDDLLHQLIANCEIARKYKFPEKEARSRDKAALADLAAASKQAAYLARYCRKHPTELMLAVGAASKKSGVYLRAGADTDEGKEEELHRASAMRQLEQMGRRIEPIPLAPRYTSRLAELLRAFSEELAAGNIMAKAGPFEHRWRHGPIAYPKPIDNAADLPSAAVCLAIVLAFLLRRGGAHYQAGEKYFGVEGRPHWGIVSALIECAFPGRVEDDVAAAKAVLRRNQQLEIWGW